MTFIYTPAFLESGLTYAAYRKGIIDTLAQPAIDDNFAQLLPNMQENVQLMDAFDRNYMVSASLRKAVEEAPETTWLVIAEGWCTDTAFNLPMMAAIERTLPGKLQLRIFLRDSNLALIDANLTDGGRSIPKLIILDQHLQKLASWGPRPAGLHTEMKAWKDQGLTHKQIMTKILTWYAADATLSIQQEIQSMLAMLPVCKN